MTIVTVVVLNICLAFVNTSPTNAKPCPERLAKASGPDKNALIELIKTFTNLQVEEQGSLEKEKMENEIDLNEDTSEKFEDEEEIDERTGVADNPHMYGDLLLSPEQEKLLNEGEGLVQGFLVGAKLWPNGIVPYELDRSLNSQARFAISNAIKELGERSCIQFVQRASYNAQNYIYFTPENGCFSTFGMIGGRQKISIGRGCEHKAIVQHEILHALGRVHEQSRPDRDAYVFIEKNNIKRGMEHNFNIMRANTGGLPYDYGSVMHYSEKAFSSNGRPTIIPRYPASIGQREGLSDTDWKHVQIYCNYVGRSH